MTFVRLRTPALTLSLGLAFAGGAAWAETSPWYLGASQTLGYDSNVFRRSDQGVVIDLPGGATTTLLPESSGLISTTRLLGGLDIFPGRQHVYANLSLDAIRYGDQPQLDSNGYGLTGGIDWETMERLSGTFTLSASRRPGNYADPQVPSGTGRVVDEPIRAAFIARLGAAQQSRLWLEAGYFYNRVDNQVDFGVELDDFLGENDVEGYDRTIPSNAVSVGARYRIGGAIILGADLRHEKGDETYKLRKSDGTNTGGRLYNEYDRSDIDLTARWIVSGASKVNARLSYTTTDNSGTLGRLDYSGPTVAAIWEWEPTGKLQSTARVSYDTEVREFSATSGSSTYPAWGLSWNLVWAATSKLSATAFLGWSEWTEEGQLRSDQRSDLSLGVRWAALRNVSFSCSVGRESRSGVGVRRDYDATLTSCTAEALLR